MNPEHCDGARDICQEACAACNESCETDETTVTGDMLRRIDPDRWRYSTEYLFPLTRAVARSSATSPARAVWYVFTIPLDVALLPVGLLGGFTGS